jgi:hypothetical protein
MQGRRVEFTRNLDADVHDFSKHLSLNVAAQLKAPGLPVLQITTCSQRAAPQTLSSEIANVFLKFWHLSQVAYAFNLPVGRVAYLTVLIVSETFNCTHGRSIFRG